MTLAFPSACSAGSISTRPAIFQLYSAQFSICQQNPYNFCTMNHPETDPARTTRLTASLLERLRRNGRSLAVAESCTGGLIADLITNISGASAVFKAGIVAYTPEAKIHLLGIDPELIARHGVVSDEVARSMAERMRLLADTDYAVATTGNLGPTMLEGKSCGLVYIAVSSAKTLYSRELQLAGDRLANKQEAALAALSLLEDMLNKEFPDAE
jgi:PncC family amidohydrolase